jgi:enamine deaminase RidA (YjgF/YER057c/UK114 family)
MGPARDRQVRPKTPGRRRIASSKKGDPRIMSDIKRLNTNARMSQVVVYGGTVYLAGQVGDASASFADQVRQVLEKIDALLASVGSDKSKILQAIVWLDDMRDFDALNEIWDAWVPGGCGPARACGEVRLAKKGLAVEITVIAAA